MDRLEAMRVFCRVVELGSFAAAADKLGQSTSAVSRWVAQLESHLQVRLLNRTTRRISLTESGQAYYERAAHLLTELDEVESAVSEQAVVPRGTLKITTSTGFAVHHLAPALAACRQVHPQLQFNVSISSRKVDLVEEGFDLALRIGDPGSQHVVARPIGKTKLLYVASPDYLKRHPPIQTPSDLAAHNCITYEHDSDGGIWNFYDEQGNKHAVQVRGEVHTDNGEFMVEAAAHGAGIGTGPCFIVRSYLEAGRLVRVLPAYSADEMTIYAVYPNRKHLSAKVRTFVSFIQQWLENQNQEQSACPSSPQ
ncbi:LysR family transcriptional regulator [Parvibium lacunae]|uniref:LysR family transcriptional regulator n=1 Tax=Parvibium lacunae TaxID=1888893 RepID=A0A368L4J5_9BURK|nr:LysR family transcriptional regulator [Parvibium lacunae]RCS58080.1 LysR family transcriptional regulator [Parvibium lacunae]